MESNRSFKDRFTLIMCWFILIMLTVTLLPILGANIRPYSRFIASLFGMDLALWHIAIGFTTFAFIQCFEILPIALKDRLTNKAYRDAQLLSIFGYILDGIACFVYWWPIKVRWEIAKLALLPSFIDWKNLFIALITLFGLSGWFLIKAKLDSIMNGSTQRQTQ